MNETNKQKAASKNAGNAVDYDLFLDCVHCGLCSSACPTYVETGNENDSPRGRIHLMRGVTDGRLELTPQVRRHLELCLDCRACETACPSGVRYGNIIEPFRAAMESDDTVDTKTSDWFHRLVLFGLFPYPDRMRRALLPARIIQRLGLDRAVEALGLLRIMSPRVRRLVSMLPKLKKPSRRLPNQLPAVGRRRARVALFLGCIAGEIFRDTHWATARVLQQNGCDVVVPQNQSCCGAIHFHAGHANPARCFADTNVAAFHNLGVDAIVVNVAGCGSMLKEYGHHWEDDQQERRAAFAAQVKDVHEFVDDLGLVPPPGRLNLTATYHDACHLAHAQKVQQAPRNLLKQVPGLTLVDLPESELCCGAAGTYNLTEPEMSARLSRRKFANILRTGAQTIATANAGCILQIAHEARAQGHKLEVVHPMDLLDRSYGKGELGTQSTG